MTLYLGLRHPAVTYLYDDPAHPDRVTGAVQSPAYTAVDRAFLEGLEDYEATLCRCGYPKSLAWHSDMDGDFEDPGEEAVCHACSAGADKPVSYRLRPTVTRDFEARPLPPFVPGIPGRPGVTISPA